LRFSLWAENFIFLKKKNKKKMFNQKIKNLAHGGNLKSDKIPFTLLLANTVKKIVIFLVWTTINI
jgi:hypothetical protein